MERLPYDPRTFREIVEADLRRAARFVIKVQDLGTIRSVLLPCPGSAEPSESRRREGQLWQSSFFIKTELLGPLELPDGSASLAVQSPPHYPDHDKLSRTQQKSRSRMN
jgi:hypothetical protein